MKVIKTDKHYMAEPDFEIDHYKDASYPPVASHYHEFYEIFLFVSGNADYVVHDKMFRLKPGDLLIIPPAIMHHPIFRDFEIPYERYVLWLSPPAFDTMKKIDPDIDYFLRPGHAKTFLIRDSVDSSRARFGQFEALTHAYREESLCYHSEGMADILRILIGINRSLYNREHVFAKAQKPSVLSNALHYIDLNLSGDLSLDTVAKALSLIHI